MSESWDLPDPARVTIGAIGEPGHRVFFLQAFGNEVEASVKCEKQQAAALAQHLQRLAGELPGAPAGEVAPAEALPPTDLAWVVGSISLGLDAEAGRILVLLEEMVDPEESDAEPATLRLRVAPAQALALAAQVEQLLAASRPLCRLCERPIDPSGHACPRLN